MASPPTKSQSLHNFDDAHTDVESPSRRPNTSSSSLYRPSPPQDFSQQASPAPLRWSTIAGNPPTPHVNRLELASESVGIPSKLDITQNQGKNSPKLETKTKGDDVEVENKPKCDERIKEETKVWNLRPRNSIRRMAEDAGGPSGTKKKLSIAISLSKEEIEEDIFSLVGKKPARRPKKRPRNVQRQLDNLFPGLRLGSISEESYRISEK